CVSYRKRKDCISSPSSFTSERKGLYIITQLLHIREERTIYHHPAPSHQREDTYETHTQSISTPHIINIHLDTHTHTHTHTRTDTRTHTHTTITHTHTFTHT